MKPKPEPIRSDRAGVAAEIGLRERCLHLLTLAGLAIAQPLLDLLARQAEFLVVHRFDRSDTWILVATLLVLIPAPLLLIEVLLTWAPRSLRRIGHSALVAALAALFWMLVLKRTPLSDSGTAAAVTAGLAGVVTAVVYLRRREVRMFLSTLAIAVPVVAGVFLLDPAVRKATAKSRFDDEWPTLEVEAPIIVVVFDEFSAAALLDSHGKINRYRYPNLAALANRATWFSNATAVAYSTTYAVPAILTGSFPDGEKVPVIADYPHNLFTLFGRTHKIWAREPITDLCPEEVNRWQEGEEGSVVSDLAIAYLHVLLPDPLRDRLPSIDDAWGDFGGAPSTTSGKSDWTLRKGAREVRKLDRRAEFDHLIEALESGPRQLRFLHVLLPHHPLEFLPSGERYSGGRIPGLKDDHWEKDVFPVRQAYQRYLLQVGFVDSAVGRLVNRLEELDLFEPAMLVLVADHGASYRPGDRRRSLTESNAKDVLSVPLLIKAPFQAKGRLSRKLVRTIDILPTMLDLLGVEPPWPMDGHSAFASEKSPEKLRVISKKRGVLEFDPKVAKKKYETVREKLRSFGDGKDPLDLYRYGPAASLVGRSLDQVKRGQRSPRKVWVNAGGLQGGVAVDATEVPVFLQGEVLSRSAEKSCCHLAVAVNGTIFATLETVPRGRRRHFSVMLPREAIGAGANRLAFFEVHSWKQKWQLFPMSLKGKSE